MTNRFKIFAPTLKASLDDDGKRRLHGIASSTVKDRHGDVMAHSALIDMERSASNLTIFLNHEYRVPEDVAGSVERASIRSHPSDPGVHDLMFDIVINEANPRAINAWEAIQNGTLLGLSIGAMIPDGGAKRDKATGSIVIDHVELLETSLVGVPANPRSWVEYAIKSLDPDIMNSTLSRNEIEEILEEEPEETEGETEKVEPEEIAQVVEPEAEKATVSIETPYANITVDTGNRGGKSDASGAPSQEAQMSAPETEVEDKDEAQSPWDSLGLATAKSVDEETDLETEDPLEPSVLKSLAVTSDLLRSITSELIETKKKLGETESERDRAIEEKDRMAEEAEKALRKTAELLERLSNTPLGRRAVVRQSVNELDGLKSVYGDEFMNILKRKDR